MRKHRRITGLTVAGVMTLLGSGCGCWDVNFGSCGGHHGCGGWQGGCDGAGAVLLLGVFAVAWGIQAIAEACR